MTGGNCTREAGMSCTLSCWRNLGRRRWTNGPEEPSVSLSGKISSLGFNTKLSIQPSCPSGSVSDLVRSLESPSLLMMMMRVRVMLLPGLLMKRRRKKRRKKKMNKPTLFIENYKEINPLNQLTIHNRQKEHNAKVNISQ